ncbi:MAG: ATPase, T2SS/T4P/T4SS family [Microthrixaceae bacterium]
MRRIIDKIVSAVGRRADESMMVDARLPDGSRVNAVVSPLAMGGPFLTIRKFSTDPLQVDDLIRFGSFNAHTARFLQACIVGKLNVIVSGGTGTGKTLLNVLSSFIPADERIITVEDSKELQPAPGARAQPGDPPAQHRGSGRGRFGTWSRTPLRMRPDRIVVGECRSGEALDMLQAMNTGHDGSLTTIHANTPRDCLSRLETLVLMSGFDLPVKAIREQVSSAVDLIVQLTCLRRQPPGDARVGGAGNGGRGSSRSRTSSFDYPWALTSTASTRASSSPPAFVLPAQKLADQGIRLGPGDLLAPGWRPASGGAWPMSGQQAPSAPPSCFAAGGRSRPVWSSSSA